MRIKRLLVILLVLSMLTGSVSMLAAAQETEVPEQEMKVPGEFVTAEGMEEEQDLFAAYVEKQMYANPNISLFSGNYAELVLDELNYAIYQELKTNIERIAKEGGSAVVDIPESVYGDQFVVTWQETQDATVAAVKAKVQEKIHTKLILECLLVDCPYELYWFDKTEGFSVPYLIYEYPGQYLDVQDLQFKFCVEEGYQATEYDTNNPAVKSDVSAVSSAIENAKMVVAANATKTDREKLVAYKEYICNAVDYNDGVVDGNVDYGDPWQLVYVFDNNPETNVVCEGYSKAFQYLCELSTFYDDAFASYIVSGTSTMYHPIQGEPSGGAHMWNVVTLGGVNYLVDVTDSDVNGIGERVFMVLNPEGGTAEGYQIAIDSNNVLEYLYGEDDIVLYSDSIRTLSDKATYAVILGAQGSGTVRTKNKYVKANTQVDLNDATAVSVQAERGYRFARWETYADGVLLNENRFTMPAKDVSIQAIFVAWLMGDLDANDVVGEEDVELLKAFLTGGYTTEDTYPMEFYQEGEISSRNLVRLKRYVDGNIESLEVLQ
ncbi:MAG: hypothetical protein UHS49_00770 [Faecalimonas sp.]|nr:hypothetical protein [Faecalimonas sp.]